MSGMFASAAAKGRKIKARINPGDPDLDEDFKAQNGGHKSDHDEPILPGK
jgi:hypothetical protein